MQAAVRGGDCSRNIRRVFRHLAGGGPDGRTPTPDSPPQLWLKVMGEVAQPLWGAIMAVPEGALRECPAA
eukprot:12482540-Alexandrium_andersonii.AAC.1